MLLADLIDELARRLSDRVAGLVRIGLQIGIDIDDVQLAVVVWRFALGEIFLNRPQSAQRPAPAAGANHVVERIASPAGPADHQRRGDLPGVDRGAEGRSKAQERRVVVGVDRRRGECFDLAGRTAQPNFRFPADRSAGRKINRHHAAVTHRRDRPDQIAGRAAGQTAVD